MRKVVVIGCGYVGLPAALLLAKAGHQVVGVDINTELVSNINKGKIHIEDEKLQSILNEPSVRKNFIATNKPDYGDVFIIAVPTPIDRRRKVSDLSYVMNAIESILPFLRKGNLVIVESTIPPLTCRERIKPLLEKTGLNVGNELFLAHCPERVLPGNIHDEIIKNDRIIGGINEKSNTMAKEIYETFIKSELLITDDVTAEFCKLMENTYRDVNIALANEFSLIAESVRVDIHKAIEMANKHPRVKIHTPGIGVGGHCIPIDPWFIAEIAPDKANLIRQARIINDNMPRYVASKIRKILSKIKNPKIVLLGRSYKPNVADERESPAIEIYEILKTDGYDVESYDPFINGYKYSSLLDITKGIDCLIILVKHKIVLEEFNREKEKILNNMRHKIVIEF